MHKNTARKKEKMRYCDSILDTLGNTPLVRLRTVASDVKPLVLAKDEFIRIDDRASFYWARRLARNGTTSPPEAVTSIWLD